MPAPIPVEPRTLSRRLHALFERSSRLHQHSGASAIFSAPSTSICKQRKCPEAHLRCLGVGQRYGYDSMSSTVAPVFLISCTTLFMVRGMNWLESPTMLRANVAPSTSGLKPPELMVNVV